MAGFDFSKINIIDREIRMFNACKLFLTSLIHTGLCIAAVTAATFGRFEQQTKSKAWQEIMNGDKIFSTQFFPNYGQTIRISGESRTDGATKEIPAIKLQYALKTHKITKSVSVFTASSSKWKHFSKTVSLKPHGSLFRITLKNAEVRNLKVTQSFSNQDFISLTGDSGFEGRLGADHWFTNSKGKDWDGIELNKRADSCKVDNVFSVCGNKCLKIVNAGTVKSHRFAYKGEKLLVSAWIKTENIKIGRKSWEMAGIQVIGFNSKGVGITHIDLRLVHGTTPWTFYSREISFPKTVKYVAVWCRVFNSATGTAWFDEVSLLRKPQTHSVKPFNSKKTSVFINYLKPESQKIQPVWAGIDGLYTNWITDMPYWEERLELLKKAGFDYLRCRGIIAMGTYDFDDKYGNPVYDWTKFDKFFDIVVKKYKFKMFPTLSPTPLALLRKDKKAAWNGLWNNSAPSDYVKYKQFIKALVARCIKRYGKDTVSQWKWEFWNEPHTSGEGDLHVTPPGEEYPPVCYMYEKVLDAFAELEEEFEIDLQLSITSGGFECDEIILDYLKTECPQKMKNIDALSIHRYAGACSPLQVVAEDGDKLKARAQLYKLRKNVKFWCTEWNASSMVNTLMDQSFAAALAPRFVKIFLDKKFDMTTVFSENDYPYGYKRPLFCGDTGLMTRTGIPKPIYNAFCFLKNLHEGFRLPLKSTNNPVDGIAVKMKNGNIGVVLFSFDEDNLEASYTTQVTVSVKTDKKLKMTKYYLVDKNNGNAYTKWLQMGKPSAEDLDARKKMSEAAKYKVFKKLPGITNKNNVSVFRISMPEYSVVYIELSPSK